MLLRCAFAVCLLPIAIAAQSPQLVHDFDPRVTHQHTELTECVQIGSLLLHDMRFHAPGEHLGVYDLGAQALGSIPLDPNGTGGPELLGVVGARAVFCADHGALNRVLWGSDGTESGTKPLLLPGNEPVGIRVILAGPGVAHVFGADRTGSPAIWTTDGTLAGTQPLVRLPSGSVPSRAWRTGRGIWFEAFLSGIAGIEPFYSDGTAVGTRSLGDLYPGLQSSASRGFVDVGSLTFFTAQTLQGRELWVSDGTSAGTRLVVDLNPGSGDGVRGSLARLGNKIYFGGDDGSGGIDLFESDGTANGTKRVADLPGLIGEEPRYLTAVGTRLLFTCPDPVAGRELWVSDGTANGTKLLVDIWPGRSESMAGVPYGDALVVAGGRSFFFANDGTHGTELWVSDGTPNGTHMVRDLAPPSLTASSSRLFLLPAGLFGCLGDSVGVRRPYLLDPQTLALSSLGTWARPFTKSGDPELLGRIGRYLVVHDRVLGQRLLLDPGPDTLSTAAQLWPAAASWKGFSPIPGGQRCTYLHVTSTSGANELWRSDGTAPGTVRLLSAPHAAAMTWTTSVLEHADEAFFLYDDGTHGTELWRSDGTAAGTRMFADLSSLPYLPTQLGRSARLGDLLALSLHADRVHTRVFGPGRLEGSFELFGPGKSVPEHLGTWRGLHVFAAFEAATGLEPWVSDGTPSGTRLLADLDPGTAGRLLQDFAAFGDEFFFTAEIAARLRLVRSDGTSAGTAAIRLDPRDKLHVVRLLGATESQLFFTGYIDSKNPGLYAWDGRATEATRLVDGLVWWSAPLGTRRFVVGMELPVTREREYFVSDGTVAGTAKFLETAPGSESSDVSRPVQIGNAWYWVGFHPSHGRELLKAKLDTAAATPRSMGCGHLYRASTLRSVDPVLGRTLELHGEAAPAGSFAVVFVAAPLTVPLMLGDCPLQIDLNGAILLGASAADARGAWRLAFGIPPAPSLTGLQVHVQSFVLPSPATRAFELSEALHWRVGR